jgi:hypothetical protein
MFEIDVPSYENILHAIFVVFIHKLTHDWPKRATLRRLKVDQVLRKSLRKV